MPDKLTDNEIVKALEYEANEKVCIHEVYEPACGVWCKHLHLWCTDFNGNSNKNNCSAFKPTATNKRTKAILNLINRLQAENERLEHQLETLCLTLKLAKAEAYREFAERLKIRSHTIKTADGIVVECTPLDYIDNLLQELVGEKSE